MTPCTGANARLQVTFRDNTNLTLGENATVVVDRFVFDPDAGVGEATLNATKGAFRMVTGRITDMPKKNIRVKTSFGAAAVRGTDFWSGSVQGQTGVLLVHNSRVDVRGENAPRTPTEMTRCRCAVILDRAEEGTYIDRRTGCPCSHAMDRGRDKQCAIDDRLLFSAGPSQALPAGRSCRRAAGFCGFHEKK